MSEKREELMSEITKWQTKISEDEIFLELAFFKVFVKFENFLTDIIIDYATGAVSNPEKVERRLNFVDREHFKKTTNLIYLDTSDKTKTLVDQLFTDNNKISFFFNSSDNEFFEKMKALRNYIAHESVESRNKYVKKTLNNRDFIAPNDFLKSKNRNDQDSMYTKFVNMVVTYASSIDFD
ncbi:hypothetical protein ACG7YO_002015 [Enterococcus faecalis]